MSAKLLRLLLVFGLLSAGGEAFLVSAPAAETVIKCDGLIEPHRVIQLGSPVAGTIETIRVDRGDQVTKGEALVRLQSSVEKATLELAKARAELNAAIKAKRAELEYAKRSKQRNQILYDQDVLPLQQWDDLETRRILAESQLAEALENKQLAQLEYGQAREVVQRKTILSPINGVVMEKFLQVGEYVETQPILKLAEIDTLNVEVILPVSLWKDIKMGMQATIKPQAPVGGTYSARVAVVDKVIDAASGTFGVRLELPNPKLQLPPGLKCEVLFHVRK